MISLIIIILLVLLVIWSIPMYNSLQRTKVQVDETNSQIDVQLKREMT